ncbi:plasmid pRiA4b ORF-3 family protein [Oceanispirochaeta sp.]|jgi:hypothetical protein|uniref:plasmid pRiA4b ORF-3 family protein n=1 Tax=Oceanispirochaeta sp. TaxID=2035350 RepID=UPI002624EC3A|nr:plasmid pRiA4b ORF-3 family protein [Oceanispirochaeta sp.]MDA3957894.1 plasmid pRiA4b ORF-3 family protein [Oceanispirochaeta sp.]
MDEVLHQMHLGFNELIIQAFILDALFHHNCSIETVSERILRDLPEEHRIAVEEFEQPFQDALKKQIKVLKSTYNVFMDQQTGAIREAALRLSDDLTSWLRNLGEYGVYADEIPEEGMEQLLHFTREIDSILLETMEPVVLPEERKVNTLDYLKELRLQQEKLLDNLLFPEYLPSVYTVKMTLTGARPPVWRRLRLPGNCTLDDLHSIIQTAFNWDDEHLHMFSDEHKTRYVSPATTREGEEEDEERFMIDDLLTRPRQVLKYTYDFGDDWRVGIVVEKIEEYDSYTDADDIVCLAGKGNSPPENCGGLPGFRNMIESGMTPWGDPYEPEIFDPEELTRILKERDTEKTFRSAGE